MIIQLTQRGNASSAAASQPTIGAAVYPHHARRRPAVAAPASTMPASPRGLSSAGSWRRGPRVRLGRERYLERMWALHGRDMPTSVGRRRWVQAQMDTSPLVDE